MSFMGFKFIEDKQKRERCWYKTLATILHRFFNQKSHDFDTIRTNDMIIIVYHQP